jgi:hypothetical protein
MKDDAGLACLIEMQIVTHHDIKQAVRSERAITRRSDFLPVILFFRA